MPRRFVSLLFHAQRRKERKNSPLRRCSRRPPHPFLDIIGHTPPPPPPPSEEEGILYRDNVIQEEGPNDRPHTRTHALPRTKTKIKNRVNRLRRRRRPRTNVVSVRPPSTWTCPVSISARITSWGAAASARPRAAWASTCAASPRTARWRRISSRTCPPPISPH